MVYSNTISQTTLPGYANETFRARHHYKETETPNSPFRRNRDFKPVPYGSAKGILNWRHSEPYCLLKNMKDIVYEESNVVIRWTKKAIVGSMLGAAAGTMYFWGAPTGNFEMNKLFAATGSRNYSGRTWR